MKLDHVMYAAGDLASGMDRIEQLVGVRPEPGGSHDGAGTRNALLGLGDDVYLEVIAPDPEQSLDGTLGATLALIREPLIRTWAIAVNGFEGLPERIQAAGLRCQKTDMSRMRPDGVLLKWQILFVAGHPFGTLMPFFIDWQQSPHPAETLPAGIQVRGFTVNSSARPELGETLKQWGLGDYVDSTTTGSFELVLEGPVGEVILN